MKTTCKKIYKFVTVLLEMFVFVLSVTLFSSFGVGRSFKNIQKTLFFDYDVHILCNGPSLKDVICKQDFKGLNLLAVNYFALTDAFITLKPNYYIILDPNLSRRSSNQLEQRNKLIEAIAKVSWKMILFVPRDISKDWLEKMKHNECVKIIKYNQTPVSGFRGISHYIYKKSLGMPLPQNVLNAAIFCAINAGFKHIYLYGAEHSWMKNFDVDESTHRVYLNDGHFYKSENIRYMPKGSYKKWLRWIYLMMNSHDMLREYANYRGVTILNRTPNSFIDAYDFDLCL